MALPSKPTTSTFEPVFWWIADAICAIAFAACLAELIGFVARQGAVMGAAGIAPGAQYFSVWPLAGIVLAGTGRGLVQALALSGGQVAANHRRQQLRARLHPLLLATANRRGRLAGAELRSAVDDIEATEGLAARFAPLRRAAVVSPLLVACAVAWASWVSATILLFTLIPFAVGMALAGLAARGEADRQLAALTRLSGLFVDRVRQLPLILAYVGEARVTRQLATASRDVAERTLDVLRVAFASSAILEFFAALSVALVAVYCGFSLLGLLPFPAPERLDLPRAMFALALAPEFYLPMRRLAAAYHDKQQGEAAETALATLENAAAAMLTSAPPPAVAPRDLAVDALVMRYPDGTVVGPLSAAWTMPGLHLITGETGAGKSSLLLALAGQIAIASGRIQADGSDLQPGALRGLIGWAGQSPVMLPGTLRDNLTLAAPGTADTELLELLAALALDHLVAQRGLDLPIDQRGSGLSGGERRRIGLARALLSHRPILLLDEPTADLDPRSAAAVLAMLGKAARSRLVLVATHDPRLGPQASSVTRLA